jgi:hypothetical protein
MEFTINFGSLFEPGWGDDDDLGYLYEFDRRQRNQSRIHILDFNTGVNKDYIHKWVKKKQSLKDSLKTSKGLNG